MFTLIFGGLFLAGWLLCAYVPWVVLSVTTRGGAGLAVLLLCLLAGVVGALAVPMVGFDGGGGLIASFAVAAAAPTLLLGVRRFSFAAMPARGKTPPAVRELPR